MISTREFRGLRLAQFLAKEKSAHSDGYSFLETQWRAAVSGLTAFLERPGAPGETAVVILSTHGPSSPRFTAALTALGLTPELERSLGAPRRRVEKNRAGNLELQLVVAADPGTSYEVTGVFAGASNELVYLVVVLQDATQVERPAGTE